MGGAPGWSAEGQGLVPCHVDKTKSQRADTRGSWSRRCPTALALDSEEMSVPGLEGHLDRPHLFSSRGGRGEGRAGPTAA